MIPIYESPNDIRVRGSEVLKNTYGYSLSQLRDYIIDTITDYHDYPGISIAYDDYGSNRDLVTKFVDNLIDDDILPEILDGSTISSDYDLEDQMYDYLRTPDMKDAISTLEDSFSHLVDYQNDIDRDDRAYQDHEWYSDRI